MRLSQKLEVMDISETLLIRTHISSLRLVTCSKVSPTQTKICPSSSTNAMGCWQWAQKLLLSIYSL